MGTEFALPEAASGPGSNTHDYVVSLGSGFAAVWHGPSGAGDSDVYARLFSLPATGIEDRAVSLPAIATALTDTDGSETLVLTLSGFPAGATFSVGEAGSGADAGKWIISDPFDVASLSTTPLTMTPPTDYNGSFALHVDAVVTDFAVLSTGGASDSRTFTQDIAVNVSAVNDAPVLADVAANATYVANEAATVLAPDLTVSDVDNATAASATVRISSGFVDGDMLWADNAGTGILVTYDPLAGVLTLTGADTREHYQQVLDSVSFSSTSHDPTDGGASTSRTVDWQVDDGADVSAVQQTTVDITSGGAGGQNATFGGDLTGVAIEDGTASGGITPLDFDSGTLWVNDPDSGEDHFQEVEKSALHGQYGNFTFDHGTGDWTYALDHERADDLIAGEVQHDMLTVTSADGSTEVIDVTVIGTNDAPLFDGDSPAPTVVAGDAAVAIATGVSASDIDSADFDGGSLTVSVTNSHGGDALSIASVGAISLEVSGNRVMFDFDGAGDEQPVQIGTLFGPGRQLPDREFEQQRQRRSDRSADRGDPLLDIGPHRRRADSPVHARRWRRHRP